VIALGDAFMTATPWPAVRTDRDTIAALQARRTGSNSAINDPALRRLGGVSLMRLHRADGPSRADRAVVKSPVICIRRRA